MTKRSSSIILILSVAIGFLAVAGCSKEEMGTRPDPDLTDEIVVSGKHIPDTSLVQGSLKVKVSPALAERLEENTDPEGNVVFAKVRSVENILSDLDITGMKRSFPYAGEFEPRTREAGLHLWYDITFNRKQTLTRASDNLMTVDGIEYIEYQPKIRRIRSRVVDVCDAAAINAQAGPASALPFDDPSLKRQWHYINDGSVSGSVEGCDINVLPVWEAGVYGDPKVIVSVVDGGIDFTHEDLKDNMWHNPEKSGDEAYGFNFATGTYRVTPDDHGTHVAGTIAAVNNNGTGVCGIAGGNSREHIEGVRLMSCQIFDDAVEGSGSGAEAIKWGADHGAVISQNSWGYDKIDYTPQSVKVAIDYFVEWAGKDNAGNQTGPMSGGVVIFAAGNDNKAIGYPAEYEKAVAVASVGYNFRRAYYSNYGPWVDISAPGGDAKVGQTILSTLPGNKYGTMQGTSMACPHVSGVAALIVSKNGCKGFTNADLRERLEMAPTPMEKYNNVPMGKGLVNAFTGVLSGTGVAPDPITDLTVTSLSNTLHFSMTLPEDKDSEKPSSVIVYYGENSYINNMKNVLIDVTDRKVGDRIEGRIENLKFSTPYYLTAVTVDNLNNRSSFSPFRNVTTGINNPPVIDHNGPLEGLVRRFEYAQFKIPVHDPDRHRMEAVLDPELPGFKATVKQTENGDTLILSVTGIEATLGLNETTVTVRDAYGMEDRADVKIDVRDNMAPEVIQPIGNITFNGTDEGTLLLDPTEYFTDQDGEQLFYNFKVDNPDIVNVKFRNEKIQITPKSFGMAQVEIIARDGMGKTASQTVSILIRDGSYAADIYPNPVIDILHVRTGTAEKEVGIDIFANNGAKVFSDLFDIDPFQPAEIDMRSFSGGIYTIVVRYGNNEDTKEIISNIVKL